ncbi:hypothetical protein THAOC_00426, partial [Thalassiosira oceanica]
MQNAKLTRTRAHEDLPASTEHPPPPEPDVGVPHAPTPPVVLVRVQPPRLAVGGDDAPPGVPGGTRRRRRPR